MTEHQHLEWKSSWRDEHMKWICAFANAQGGVLEIGRDDKGRVVGLPNAERLMEELPNKLRDLLGLVADIHLLEEDGKPYLRIEVDPYPYPVSYKGEYHVRSGSTKQVLRGQALDRFLLSRTGKRWDAVPVPGVSVRDLNTIALSLFRERAAKAKRLSAEDLTDENLKLIEKLRLTDGEYLKRAAVLLFHPDPERFFNGAAVKIGYFASESDLRYHDEVGGDLFSQVGKTMELLLSKYLKAAISYESIQRIESYPIPEGALREALLNAVVHRDYAVAAPIQIRVYADRLRIWNPGELPEGWSEADLLGPHASLPFNPDVANVFFRAGEIEAWGRGIERVFNACKQAGTPEPRIRVEQRGVWFEFPFSESYLAQVTGEVSEVSGRTGGSAVPEREGGDQLVERLGDRLGEKLGETEGRVLLLIHADQRISTRSMAKEIGVSTTAIDKTLAKLKDKGVLRRVGPARGGHWEILEVQE